MTGIAMITEACIGTEDRACVDVCPGEWMCEFDPVNNVVFSQLEAGGAVIDRWHVANAEAVAIFGGGVVDVIVVECPSSAWWYRAVVRSGRLLRGAGVSDGTPSSSWNSADTSMGGMTTRLFAQLTGDVVAD